MGRVERVTQAFSLGQADSGVAAVFRSFAPGSEPFAPPCAQEVGFKPKHGNKVFCVLLKARRVAEPQRSIAGYTTDVKVFRRIVGFSSEHDSEFDKFSVSRAFASLAEAKAYFRGAGITSMDNELPSLLQ